MNFTREPIIETIITPKEGYKLILKNSKGTSTEEYSVDAVEVVSFGSSIFYRSLERPKAFLLPVSDFEVQETRETRIVLKNATLEKSVKIASETEKTKESQQEKKKEKKKTRKKKTQSKKEVEASSAVEAKEETPKKETPEATPPVTTEDSEMSTAVFTQLFPPPSGLIADSISKLKEAEESESKIELQEDQEGLNEFMEDRKDIVSSIELEEKKLDHIWTIDSEVESGESLEAVKVEEVPEVPPIEAEEATTKKPLTRRKVKQETTTFEKEVEELEAETSNVILKEEKEPSDTASGEPKEAEEKPKAE